MATPARAAESQTTQRARGDHRATQEAVDAAVAAGIPGAVASAQRGDRDRWFGQAGTADLRTGVPRRAEDRYRAGSITKTFVATVMLQLAAERKLSLDDTVDHWLPGLIQGNGHDGTRITLRQILNHTSGIYSYTEDKDFQHTAFSTDFLRNRFDTWSPRRIVALAMTHKPDFAPGADWHYSDTNYTVAGMVIEKATGRAYADEIERRILRPLHLNATTLPGTESRMPRPAGRAYSKLTGSLDAPGEPDSPLYDVTELNPSIAGAGGEIVSTTGDLNRFYQALMSGRLLKPRQLDEMTTTVPIKGTNLSYGLGLMKVKSSCGKDLWGHNGGIQGSGSETLVTTNGDHALSINYNADWGGPQDRIVEAEFCGK
nr:serine hydrolase domain-containing protein [Streptomyces sp. SID3343]